MRRRLPVVVAALALVAAGAVVVAMTSGDGSTAADDDEALAATGTSVEVVRRDLVRTRELDGTVSRGDPTPIVLAADGTVTWLPAVGDIVGPLDPVVEVDGRPVLLAEGTFPYWRTLGPGVSDGADVLQFEYFLALHGYAQEHGVEVDDRWSAATTRATRAFQEDHGLDVDGRIDLGELLVIGEPVRIAAVEGAPGQAVGEVRISTTPPDQTVRVDLDVDDAALIEPNLDVVVELPSGDEVTGTVSTVHPVTTEGGSAHVPVDIELSGAPELDDGTSVTVVVETSAVTDVLTVPVEALLALAEGGYAVEVVDGSVTRLVPVRLGMFADAVVEIEPATIDGVAAGDRVVIP